MREYNDCYLYDADDEEPDCMRRGHVCDPDSFCHTYCGPDNGWFGYKRLEYKDQNTKTGNQ